METHQYSFPTDVPDIDREILIRLSLNELEQVISAYPNLDGVCNASFWHTKFTRDYTNLGAGIDYKDLYYKINSMDINEQMFFATKHGYIKLLEWTLAHGADVHTKDPCNGTGEKALSIAVNYNNLEAAKMLIEHKANIHAQLNNIFFSIANRGDADMLQLFVDNGADIHILDGYIMLVAVNADNLSVIKRLIALGININIGEEGCDNPLLMAIDAENLDIVKVLLENKANVHISDDMALIEAVLRMNIDLVSLLLEYGSNIHARNDESLLLAIDGGDMDMIKFLLDHGANIPIDRIKMLAVGKTNRSAIEYILQEYENRAGMPTETVLVNNSGQCIATTKLGNRCKNRTMKGDNYCRIHKK